MAYLLDTNVLLRLFAKNDRQHRVVQTAVELLGQTGTPLYCSPQNIAELWNVVTRPLDRNGFGFSPDEAEILVTRLEQVIDLLPDTPSIYLHWRRLIREAAVSGVQVHDARLVAWMQSYDIHDLLTLNPDDFRRYEKFYQLTVHTPSQLIL